MDRFIDDVLKLTGHRKINLKSNMDRFIAITNFELMQMFNI